MLKKLIKKNSLRICFEIILLSFSLWLGAYFQWEIANLIFFLLGVVLILHRVKSRFSVSGAIFFLVLTAILLIFGKNDWGERSAIWAYYLMIFTAILSFLELQEEKDDAIITQESD